MRAPFIAARRQKAQVHTFLAWQEPPGLRFGIAIGSGALDPHAVGAGPFVDWFRRVYELDPLA